MSDHVRFKNLCRLGYIIGIDFEEMSPVSILDENLHSSRYQHEDDCHEADLTKRMEEYMKIYFTKNQVQNREGNDDFQEEEEFTFQ